MASETVAPRDFTSQSGHKIPLRVSTFVTSIHNINSAKNCFDCDFSLSLSWDDPRVIEKGCTENSYLTLGSDVLNPDLRPDVFIINDVAGETDANVVQEEIYVSDIKKGTVVNNRRMRGTFYSIFDVRRFPFDVHVVQVKMYFHSCYVLSGPVPNIKTGWFSPPGSNEFYLSDTINDHQYDITSKASGMSFEGYHFEVTVARQFFSYLMNVVSVVECLFVLSLTVNMLPADELNDRMNMTLIIVLTYSAFKMVVANSVPAVGYMTLLDMLVMGGFLLGACGGIVTLFLNTFALDSETSDLVDYWVVVVEINIWVVLHLWVFYRSEVYKSYESRIKAAQEAQLMRNRSTALA